MEVKQIAALCSALRYRCQLEAINLASALFYRTPGDHEQRCRWLAYAIFYPRSKKLAAANTFQHIEMDSALFEASGFDAFRKTLADPARELVYQGLVASGAPQDELFLLTIKQGAKIYAAPQVAQAALLYELAYEKELEALCELDGWACLVLPGIGVGWVASDEVVSTEREPIDRNSVRVEWGFTGIHYGKRSHTDALPAFFEHVRPRSCPKSTTARECQR